MGLNLKIRQVFDLYYVNFTFAIKNFSMLIQYKTIQDWSKLHRLAFYQSLRLHTMLTGN
jgi:hypothetical protein